jgi:dTDP-4-dehydrorhamnose reductase
MKKKILIIGKRSIIAKTIKKKLQPIFFISHISFNDFKKIKNKILESFHLVINCSFKKNFHTLKNNPDVFIAKKIKNTSLNYVMLSSSKVYGTYFYKKKISENYKCNPLTKYGLIRFKTENILNKILSERLLILRISNVLMFDTRRNNFSENFINKMLNTLKYKSLIIVPKKKIFKDFITVEFLAESLYKLIKKNANGIFNISSSFGMSLKEIGSLLIKGFGGGKISYINANTDNFVLCNKKLFKTTKMFINKKKLNKYIFNLGNELRNE